MRLYCFPYAGGSAGVFSQWRKRVDGDIEVCAVQLPGRGTRFHELPVRDLDLLVDVLAERIAGQPPLPFAFFGHSLGALVAFEVSSRLQEIGGALPLGLMVSGCSSPRLREPPENLHLLPKDELIRALQNYQGTPAEVLNNAELMELVLPVLRADFALAERYQYVPRPPLAMPIAVLAGRDDEYTTLEQVDAWRLETTGTCEVHWFDGHHFFLQKQADAVNLYVNAQLSAWRSMASQCNPPTRAQVSITDVIRVASSSMR
ncbi:thioesterase II family protein [Duganella rhizosphaerae]|uniref:thioesterase II family protein n=1 Tax=Duganella rhizosphaerae TaxID=2885763 RepID=UPI00403FBF89